MRNNRPYGVFAFGVVIIAGIIILNFFSLRAVRAQYVPGQSGLSAAFDLTGQFREWLIYLGKWKSLAVENKNLNRELEKRESLNAKISALEAENEFLRQSLNLPLAIRREMIEAGIFSMVMDSAGYRALINKGDKAGLKPDQVVISPEGLLAGKVGAVYSNSAEVILVPDPQFTATVKVLSGRTSGIVKGALKDGLEMSLFSPSDLISEGDLLVTTVDDFFPAGLVVGKVKNIQNSETELFQRVKVDPAFQPRSSSVVIIK